MSAAGILVPGGTRANQIKSCFTDTLSEFWRVPAGAGPAIERDLVSLKALPGPARCSQLSVKGPDRGRQVKGYRAGTAST